MRDDELNVIAGDIRREADLSSRAGQMQRLLDIADRIEALAAPAEGGQMDALHGWVMDGDTIPAGLIETCRDAIRMEFGDNGTDGYYKRILVKVFRALIDPAGGAKCGCGLTTCVEPREPGCGLGNSEEHAQPAEDSGTDDKVVAWRVSNTGKHWALRKTEPRGWRYIQPLVLATDYADAIARAEAAENLCTGLHGRIDDYEHELSAVIFKDWYKNSRKEWPAVAAAVIRNLRESETLAWQHANIATSRAEAAERDAAMFRFVMSIGKLPVRCSTGYYYEDGVIHPTPEAAIAAQQAEGEA